MPGIPIRNAARETNWSLTVRFRPSPIDAERFEEDKATAAQLVAPRASHKERSMAVRMSVVWAVRLSFAVALVSLQAFGDTFSGPPAAPFSWTPISGAPCFRTMDANANPVMQCDSNSSIVVSGGGSATWDNYYVHVAPNQSHFIRVYGRWQNVNNYYVFEYDPTGVNQFPVTLSAV